MDTNSIVVLGAGPAGAKAAETLRAEGFTASLTLIGAEPELPYQRPPLSKGYLSGSETRDSVFLHDAQWYGDNGIELRLGLAAESLDRDAHEVALSDGARVSYDRLLLATGSRPRQLSAPGADLDGVRYLRTLPDSDALRAALADAKRVVVIGGGWIGLEVASAARDAGCEVTIVEQAELPLLRVLGPQVAAVFAELHRSHGVDLRLGTGITRLVGSKGALSGVELSDGTVIAADLAVVGVGAAPNTEMAEAAGLEVANGVVVDENLRTSDPAIWAAGDIARAFHPLLGQSIRVEHSENALHQGPAAARSMLGRGEPYTDLPFFYSDQYDLGMEYVGYVEPGSHDEVVLRGDVPGLRFVAFWLAGGRVRAAMHVNEWDATDHLRALIAAGRPVEAARLADTSIPLADL